MSSCPTVKIKHDNPAFGGYVVINESDFDKDKHELYAEPADKPAPKPKKAASEPAEKPAE